MSSSYRYVYHIPGLVYITSPVFGGRKFQPADYLFDSPKKSTSSVNIMSSGEHPKSGERSYSNSKNSSSSKAEDTKGPTVVRNQTHVVPPKISPTIIDIVDSPAKSPVHRPRELVQSPLRPHSSSKSTETVKDPKQRLDEITEAVKPFLRPYYKDGKIDKDKYKVFFYINIFIIFIMFIFNYILRTYFPRQSRASIKSLARRTERSQLQEHVIRCSGLSKGPPSYDSPFPRKLAFPNAARSLPLR